MAIATRKMALATTLTCGGTETRAIPQTKTGNVCVTLPPLKYVMTKSSIESAKPSSAAASIAGASNGSVTLRNVVISFAPRSIAASSRCRSKPIRRAFTVTTMKLTMNITWAMKIVPNPSWKTAVVLRKSVSSDAPSTISGVDIGRNTRRFVAPRPTKRWRTIASAMSVPSAVATIVASRPIWSDLMTASWIPSTEFQLTQLSNVNPSQT